MIVRDKDILADLSKGPGCSVYVSVPTVDEHAWQLLEPGTAPPLKRLRAVRELADAGIRAGVIMNPIVPGITSKPALLERTIKAIADHGARFVGCNVMFLEGGTRGHFMRWLGQEFPNMVEGYSSLYVGKYAPSSYRKEISQVISLLRSKHGVSGREDADRDERSADSRADSQAPCELPPDQPIFRF
jgi:DNA repair photolyase